MSGADGSLCQAMMLNAETWPFVSLAVRTAHLRKEEGLLLCKGEALHGLMQACMAQVVGMLERRIGEDGFKRVVERITTEACHALTGAAW